MASLLDNAVFRDLVACMLAGPLVACLSVACGANTSPPTVAEVLVAANRAPSSPSASIAAPSPRPAPRDRLTGIVKVACGDGITCGLSGDGTVVCWGDAYELGRASDATGPQVIPGASGAVQIGVGQSSACARTNDHKVFCWGRAPFDRASNAPAPSSRAEAEARAAAHVVALPPVKELAVGSAHACALSDAGAVLCWGDRSDGKLGLSFTRTRPPWDAHPAPVTVPAPPSRTVAAGLNNSCAIGEDGVLRCWGSNESGELGIPPGTKLSTRPVVVAVEAPVAQISVGDQICAVDAKRRVVCFGTNDFGQAGDPARVGPAKALSSRPSGMKGFVVSPPRPVPGLAGVTEIAAGGTFSCSIRDDRTVACFGNNELGGLARAADELPHAIPVPIDGITGAQTLCVGSYHACVVVAGGVVMCWGYNAAGQLGRGMSSPLETTPEPVKPID